MFKSLNKVYPAYILIDIVLLSVSFFIPYFLRYNIIGQYSKLHLPNFQMYLHIFFLWTLFILISFNIKRLYTTDRSLSIPKEIGRVTVCVLYSSILIGAIIFFSKFKDFSRLVFLGNIIMLIIFLSGWRAIKRLILRRLIARGFHNINILIAGAGRVAAIILEEIEKTPWLGLHPIGFLDDHKTGNICGLPVCGKISDFLEVARKYFVDEVIITIPSENKPVVHLIQTAKELNLGVKIVPHHFEQALTRIEVDYLGFIPLVSYKQRQHHPAEIALKRIFDFFIALILLTILSPFLLAISVLIKIDSKGPVLYISKRAGFKGKDFNFYKFRTMIDKADRLKPALLERNEIKDGVLFKIKDDPRITRVGKFLRQYSLDELPQLFNVLKGDMSLVGPRPFLPEEAEKTKSHQAVRMNIRPGITGLAQVRGRSQLTFRKWAKWDLWYINHWSFSLDLQIIFWTIFAVIRKRGAY